MSTGNNGQSANLRPFKKGISGNPSGRPKSFGESIRRLTRDGEELVQLALKVLRGKLSVKMFDKEGNPHDAEPSIKERLEAMKWLADRGWGKALDLSNDKAAQEAVGVSSTLAAKLAALDTEH